MKLGVKMVVLFGGVFFLSAPLCAQESAAAKATRKKLQQKISIDCKEVGIKAITEDIKREMDPAVAFKIDNLSGISNNSKLTLKADNKTVEQILNDLSDKGEFGWFIKSDPKDRNDGFVILRKFKDKERGTESKGAGKSTSLERLRTVDGECAVIAAYFPTKVPIICQREGISPRLQLGLGLKSKNGKTGTFVRDNPILPLFSTPWAC
jgi:hypothetical protein